MFSIFTKQIWLAVRELPFGLAKSSCDISVLEQENVFKDVGGVIYVWGSTYKYCIDCNLYYIIQ